MTIINKRQLTPTIIELTLRSEERLPQWRAGQYMALGLFVDGRQQWRCFSMTNVSDGRTVQFGIRVGGHFTQAAAGLNVGDVVQVQGPFGEFVINPEHDRRMVMMAGGIGITPFMAMMRESLSRAGRPMALLYSFRSLGDAAYFDEITAVEKRNPYLRAHFFTESSDGITPGDQRFTQGYINSEAVSRAVAGNFQDTTFFLCGPPPFMTAMANLLRNHDVPEWRIIHEDFTDELFAKSSGDSQRISRWVYGLTVAAIVLIAGGGVLISRIPELERNEHDGTAQTTQTTQTNGGSSTTTQNTTNNNSSNTTQNSSPQPVYQPAPVYYQPTTRVS